MKPSLVFAIAVLAASLAACERTGSIRGSIFIVTRGGDNVKLGLVEMSAIPTKDAVEHLKKIDAEFMASKGAWRTTQGIDEGPANSQDLAKHIFESLPPAAGKALTDADGRFAMTLPKDKGYFLAAKASREIGSRKEEYYWLVYAKATDPPKDIILSNQNMLNDNAALILFASAAAHALDESE
jgi:hypothetical protein